MTLKKINDVLEIPDKFDEDITSNEKLIILFEKAKNCIIQMGYGHEIELLRNCYLENIGGYSIEYYYAKGGSGEIKENIVKNSYGGIFSRSFADPLSTSEVIVKDNKFENIIRYAIAPLPTHPLWMEWSDYCLKNNTLDGALLPDDCK